MNDNETRAERTQALQDLITLRIPVEQAVQALYRFGWDSEEDLGILTRGDALRLLQRYKTGELTAEDCRAWAEGLEVRDDLWFEDGFVDLLKDFLFQIATPEITEPFTPEFANRWETTLNTAQPIEQ